MCILSNIFIISFFFHTEGNIVVFNDPASSHKITNYKAVAMSLSATWIDVNKVIKN